MKILLVAASSLLIIPSAPLVSAAVTTLTSETFASATAGKTIFVKYFAPWCGHCKAMADDWEKLATEYTDKSDTILIAEIDCTTEESMDICEDAGIEGFPTLKYGDPLALEDYEGERTYDDLSEFAKTNLKPSCSPNNLDLCDEETKASINKIRAMPTSELDDAIEEIQTKLDENEDWMQDEEEKLQDAYEKLQEDFLDKAKAIKKESNFALLKAVRATMGGDAGAGGDDAEAEL